MIDPQPYVSYVPWWKHGIGYGHPAHIWHPKIQHPFKETHDIWGSEFHRLQTHLCIVLSIYDIHTYIYIYMYIYIYVVIYIERDMLSHIWCICGYIHVFYICVLSWPHFAIAIGQWLGSWNFWLSPSGHWSSIVWYCHPDTQVFSRILKSGDDSKSYELWHIFYWTQAFTSSFA